MASIFEKANNRIDRIRRDVAENVLKRYQPSDISVSSLRGGSGGSDSNTGMASGSAMFGAQASNGIDQSAAFRQYSAFKNTVATAVRPIIVRFAGQPVRVGYTVSRSEMESEKDMSTLRTKAFSLAGEKSIRENAPPTVKASIGSSVTTIESHPLLDLIGNPNEYMTGYGLMQCTAASLCLTGRVAWWFDSSGDPREETGTTTRLWYVPWHWLTPSGPRNNPYASYKLRMPHAGEIDIAGEDIFYSMVPHAIDPSKSWSAIQSQAASVDTDENILMAQHTSMKNVIRPNLIITAGRMPGMPNGSGGSKGPRALLDRTARESLTNAIKEHYQGVMKYGEPLILDALIEDVRPLIAGPMELDLVNSSAVTQSRIMQGVGTSPVVAGYSENANRSGSVVAHEIFYELVLNPLLALFGQSLDVMAKRRYGSARGGRTAIKVWMDEAKPRDVDQTHERFTACRDVMKVGEVREYLRTGNLILEEKTEVDEEWLRDFLVDGLATPQPPVAIDPATQPSPDAVVA